MIYVIGLSLALIICLLFILVHYIGRMAGEMFSLRPLLQRTNELLLGFPAVRRQSLHLRLKSYREHMDTHPNLKDNRLFMADVEKLVKILDETSTPEEKQSWWYA
jgi:hypothetical protein